MSMGEGQGGMGGAKPRAGWRIFHGGECGGKWGKTSMFSVIAKVFSEVGERGQDEARRGGMGGGRGEEGRRGQPEMRLPWRM